MPSLLPGGCPCPWHLPDPGGLWQSGRSVAVVTVFQCATETRPFLVCSLNMSVLGFPAWDGFRSPTSGRRGGPATFSEGSRFHRVDGGEGRFTPIFLHQEALLVRRTGDEDM